MKKIDIPPVLIVDPNMVPPAPGELSRLSVQPVFARSAKQAQAMMGSGKCEFSGFFVSPTVDDLHYTSIVRMAHLKHLGSPIYLLCNPGEFTGTPEDLSKLAIQEVIYKPKPLADLLALVAPAAAGFDPAVALATARLHPDPLGGELNATEHDFVAIPASRFMSGSKCYFDVYVRLRSQRYLKILHAGDTFDLDRLLSYVKRGVSHFFLRREAQLSYLAFCDHLATTLLARSTPQVRGSTLAPVILTHGEVTIGFLNRAGVDPGRIQAAKKYIKHVESLVSRFGIERSPAIREWQKNLVEYEHGSAVALLVSLMLDPMQIKSEKVRELYCLAAFLHDIGLGPHGEELRYMDFARMDSEQKNIFLQHPRVAARALSGIPGLDPSIAHLVSQHHERRDGRGLLAGPRFRPIGIAVEVIGIADEFLRALVIEHRASVIRGYEDPVALRAGIAQAISPFSGRVRKAFILGIICKS